jgi:hypothetical protein
MGEYFSNMDVGWVVASSKYVYGYAVYLHSYFGTKKCKKGDQSSYIRINVAYSTY